MRSGSSTVQVFTRSPSRVQRCIKASSTKGSQGCTARSPAEAARSTAAGSAWRSKVSRPGQGMSPASINVVMRTVRRPGSTVVAAWMRVREIYAASADNQALKIQAATLLSMDNDAEAHNYLRQLAESNDIETQLTASGALFLVGDAVSETLINQGLDSGNRNARVKAASLAGLTGYEAGIPLLRVLFQDRAVQLSTPAARALARLGVRDIVPDLISMIFELHEEKGKAAIFALTMLANEEVVEQLKFRLLEAEGVARFRLVEVLFTINDPVGVQELKDIFNNYPTLTPDVALLLATHGD